MAVVGTGTSLGAGHVMSWGFGDPGGRALGPAKVTHAGRVLNRRATGAAVAGMGAPRHERGSPDRRSEAEAGSPPGPIYPFRGGWLGRISTRL